MNPLNTPRLETNRLILRRFSEADFDALFRIFSDKEVNQFLPWFPLKTKDDVQQFYQERYLDVYAQPHGYAYAICLKDDDTPIGYVNVDAEAPYDFGYGLLSSFWHQGITTEAAQAVLAQLKADGLPYITATHDVNNPRSGAVMQRMGMTYHYSYEEQWQPKDFPVIFRLYQLNLDGNDERVEMKYWNQAQNRFVEEI